MRICFFIGSRANYGRLKMVIQEAILTGWRVDLIVASQGLKVKHEYNKYVRLKIDALMFNDTHSNMVFTTSIIAEHVSNYFAEPENRPDFALVHGDRYECLGFALAVSYNNVPLVHTEGGEITGSIDNKVRSAITALADYHFTATLESKNRLASMFNVDPKRVWFSGSPAIDYLKFLDLTTGDSMKDYGIIIFHPNTTAVEDFDTFYEAVKILQDQIKLYWINPNVDPGNKSILKKIHSLDKVEFLKDVKPELFYTYMYNCNFILGNTSAGIKEGGFLGVPYVLVGKRQDGREYGLNISFVDLDTEAIVKASKYFIPRLYRYPRCVNKWGNGLASEMIMQKLKEELEW